VRELGGLGSVGGFQGEYRLADATPLGSWRFGLFAGLEPEFYEGGFAEDVRKGGVYAALDGARGRRHVLGWVTIQNSDLTERSVVVFNNYLPLARTFNMYQGLEYDTQGPGDLGDSDLSYFFINLRYARSRSSTCREPTTAADRSTPARSPATSSTAGRSLPRRSRACSSSPAACG